MSSDIILKVVCKYGATRNRVLLEAPITKANQVLASKLSPLSRLICEGAGQRYVPTTVQVYADGILLWERTSERHGSTDVCPTHTSQRAIPFSVLAHEAENGDREWSAERLASNRLVDAECRNSYSPKVWAEQAAADLLEEAGSLRPKLAPVPNPEAYYRDHLIVG